MQIHHYLNLNTETKTIVCRECGEHLCDADQNYKEHVMMQVIEPSDGVPTPAFDAPEDILGERKDIEIRQFYCPNCGVLFDHQFALNDWPILHDMELDQDSIMR